MRKCKLVSSTQEGVQILQRQKVRDWCDPRSRSGDMNEPWVCRRAGILDHAADIPDMYSRGLSSLAELTNADLGEINLSLLYLH